MNMLGDDCQLLILDDTPDKIIQINILALQGGFLAMRHTEIQQILNQALQLSGIGAENAHHFMLIRTQLAQHTIDE